MKVELFPFQKKALTLLRINSAEAIGSYNRTHTPQVVSFTAPTGAGKTIIMAALIENILFGDERFPDQANAVIVWLSDSPELNKQSQLKIDLKADKIRLNQCIAIADESFDQELLDDGHVYFLNTQKLGKGSNLTKLSDGRQYTIWETLRNTVREKSDRLYFIIDEAHRGMLGREASRATTIMQKFIKGSSPDGLDPIPVVIGMSATTERFNALVKGTTSTIHKVVVTPDEVRSSGLLKDRIVIKYPEDKNVNKDMTVLQAAASEWKNKWDHWTQYCYEQHYAYVNPIFVIQVQNGTGNLISETNLDDCLRIIEERVQLKFMAGEVVHTFGQTTATLKINGIDVRYEEPSRINDDRNIKVVFFKENLSTGWDCPRAETMMSFRRAKDSTYIAQLLGRMVRTPMQMRIQVDETLNDVHLFLPYFERSTVYDVVKALQDEEGGHIPTDIYGESLEETLYDTYSIRPTYRQRQQEQPIPGQQELDTLLENHQAKTDQVSSEIDSAQASSHLMTPVESVTSATRTGVVPRTNHSSKNEQGSYHDETKHQAQETPIAPSKDQIDREKIMKAINDTGLLTYDVRSIQINNYLTSMFKMARLLTLSGLDSQATVKIIDEIVILIRLHIDSLTSRGKYDQLISQAKQFKMSTQVFDVFGESVQSNSLFDLYATTDSDIDRQFRLAETKLGSEGVGIAYGRKYFDETDPSLFKLDVILFISDNDCLASLNSFAKRKFHELNDNNRRYMTTVEERFRKQYDSIVSDGDIISKHNFRLPETIHVEHSKTGIRYNDHLFVNDLGFAEINLNSWEEGVLKEERTREDFLCWLRNPSRRSWSLCIPYEIDGKHKPTYPDFLIIRKDPRLGIVVDILEPHSPDFADNLAKAKGFAEYARQNPGVGRIELIRMGTDAARNKRFKRLDMSRSSIRDKVTDAMTIEELNHIFDTDGYFA